jgi:cysteine desulfurase
MSEVYLDNHSGTRLDERVLEAMLPYLTEYYGNPQSLHSLGMKSEEAIMKARKDVARLIGAQSDEIYFVSCGSEANNLAIKGVAETYKNKGKHIIVSKIEHFSVLNTVKRLIHLGFDVTYLDVDRYGIVQPETLLKALRPDTILVSIQHANPEIGSIQPLEELVKITKSHSALFHTDAVASVGFIPIDVKSLKVDFLSLAGSQFYGPKGSGALYIKKGVRITPLIEGGIQEKGIRAGTENVPAIVGLGKAAQLAYEEFEERVSKLKKLRDRLILEIPKRIEFAYLNGHPENRLPHNVNFSFEFVEGESITLFLDEKGIMVSSGSTCSSKSLKMSHVLQAIKVDPAVAQGTITMTLSQYLENQDIDYILQELPPIIARLRELSPLYSHYKRTGTRKLTGPKADYH